MNSDLYRDTFKFKDKIILTLSTIFYDTCSIYLQRPTYGHLCYFDNYVLKALYYFFGSAKILLLAQISEKKTEHQCVIL